MPKKNTLKSIREKIRFEIDPHNRLIYADGSKSKVPRFRHVLTGRFKTDKNNVLTYHIDAPTPQGVHIPHKVKLHGKWSLSDDHNLELTLTKLGRKTLGDKLTLRGRILDVRKNSLLFVISTTKKKNVQSTYVLKLQGVWQADTRNRITFGVKKTKGKHDILTFNSMWEINKQHRIIYKYEKAKLVRKRKKIHTIIFKGHWDIRDKTRLYYVIDQRSDSVFSFKTGIGIFKDKYIKYKVLIGLSGKDNPLTRTITLNGTWNIKKNVGLVFEIEYENHKVHAIAFGANVKLTAKDKISFKIKNERNKPLGGEIELSHKILGGDGEAFLRMLKTRNESTVTIGAGFRW